MELVSRDTLFGAAKQISRLKPLMQRDMTGLENGPDPYRELLTARAAFLEANTGLGEVVDGLFAAVAAMRADRLTGPYDLF